MEDVAQALCTFGRRAEGGGATRKKEGWPISRNGQGKARLNDGKEEPSSLDGHGQGK